ncbi:unnamed protein product, partial [Allacma fusca]
DERRGVMRLFPVVTLVLLTGSAVALIILTCYDDTISDQHAPRRRRSSGSWSGMQNTSQERETEIPASNSSESSSDTFVNILHRIKRSFFFNDRKHSRFIYYSLLDMYAL